MMRYLLPVAVLVAVVGCMKPFDAPEYVDIKPNETVFVVKLEGDTKPEDENAQVKFGSVEYLEKSKLPTKRVQITHRWKQTGRSNDSGEYIADVAVIKVDRSPITRIWTKDASTGTSAKNEAVEVESMDSVNFSVGFSCTAMIAEEDTAKFLYLYPNDSLTTAMDREVLGKIQRAVQEVAAKYSVDDVRGKKDEIQKAVEAALKDFKTSRGITITNVAMYGGFSYTNPEIQKAIDEAAKSQNLKVIEQAKAEAQKKTNDRLVLEAEGEAAAAKLKAQGEANAKMIAAEGEAKAISLVNEALEKAKGNPLTLQFKMMEIQKAQMEKWDGKFPQWYMGNGGTPNLMIQMPTETQGEKK